MSDETIELAENGEAVILTAPNVSRDEFVGLLLKTRPTELDASGLPGEANLRIALHPRDAQQLAKALNRAAKRCLRSRGRRLRHRYIGEFSGRHNVRERDTIDQVSSLARGMAGKRLTYRDLIADNGLGSGTRSS